MLGITSERFPRGGALALAIIGGTGSFATAIAGPVMGYLNDRFGPREMLADLGHPARRHRADLPGHLHARPCHRWVQVEMLRHGQASEDWLAPVGGAAPGGWRSAWAPRAEPRTPPGTRTRNRSDMTQFPIVQISLDLTSLEEALETAEIAVVRRRGLARGRHPAHPRRGAACGRGAAQALPGPPHRRGPEDDGRRIPRGGDDGQGRRHLRRRDGPGARSDDQARRRCRARLRHQGDGRQPRGRRSRRQRAVDGAAGRGLHHPPHRLRRAPDDRGARARWTSSTRSCAR